jgi:hypothetical protein
MSDTNKTALREMSLLNEQGANLEDTAVRIGYEPYTENPFVKLEYRTPLTPEELAAEAAAQEQAKQDRLLLLQRLKKEFGE